MRHANDLVCKLSVNAIYAINTGPKICKLAIKGVKADAFEIKIS